MSLLSIPATAIGRLAIIVFLSVPGSMGLAQAKGGNETASMQACRTIALAMFQYANDNGGKYPDGNSSTEVFQKLIDGNYVDNPTLFYTPFDGKTKGRKGERLKPENVCFDVTGAAGLHSPDGLPLVFLTGFRVDYRPGGKAVSLMAPYPVYERRTWWHFWHWWHRVPGSSFDYLAVAYVSNNAYAKMLEIPTSGNGFVRDFVSPSFDAKGNTYRQLAPDGVLKP
jgi:hypothetical protein